MQVPAKQSSTFMAIVARSFDVARSYLASFTNGPLARLSRTAVLSLLGRVEIGHIAIIDTDGSETICGERWSKEGVPSTELKVLKEAFWVRLLLFADMVRDDQLWLKWFANPRGDRCCCRDLRKVSCLVKSIVQILSTSSRYSCRRLDMLETRDTSANLVDIHPQPRTSGQRHNPDILPCIYHHKSCP